MEQAALLTQFYEHTEGIALPVYYRNPDQNSSVLRTETPQLKRLESVESAHIDEALHEIARSLQVIAYGENTYEIAVANGDVAGDKVMLHISTYSSSISGNAGNAYEFAAQSVRYPDYRHVYVASFGNGATSRLSTATGARKYAAHSGRMTWEKDSKPQPLPDLIHMYKALEAQGHTVTRIMGTDSAGGSYATGLAVAMEPGQLSHAFFSERTGFVDLSIPRIVHGMFYKEQFKNAPHNREITPDPEAMSKAKHDHAKTILDMYADTDRRRLLEACKVSGKGAIMNLLTSMQALRRGPSKNHDPLVQDTNIMLAHQPNARITYGMAEEDPLYTNAETAHQVARSFLAALSIQKTEVCVVMIPGMSHAYNTYFPNLYHAIKKDALEL